MVPSPGIEKIIESRIGRKGVGFGADIRQAEEKDLGDLLGQVLPEDLLKFGLIPEFIGRLPVIGAVANLDQDALVRILIEPKNALIKQYRKFFEFEDVELEFTDDALEAVAEQALLRGTGARGLRAILEEVLLNIMYDLPSRTDIGKCVIDRQVVLEKVPPGAEERPPPGAGRAHRRPRCPDRRCRRRRLGVPATLRARGRTAGRYLKSIAEGPRGSAVGALLDRRLRSRASALVVAHGPELAETVVDIATEVLGAAEPRRPSSPISPGAGQPTHRRRLRRRWEFSRARTEINRDALILRSNVCSTVRLWNCAPSPASNGHCGSRQALDPDSLALPAVVPLFARLDAMSKLLAGAKLRLARKLEEAGRRRDPAPATPLDYLARKTGTYGAASRHERGHWLGEQRATDRALAKRAAVGVQATAVSDAAAVDPGAERGPVGHGGEVVG